MAQALNLALVIGAVDRATRPLRRISGAVQALGERSARMGQRLSGLGQSASLRLTLPITAAGGFALKAAADIESMETGFTSMLGDAAKAKSLTEGLMNFAARTPFQLLGIGGATRQLLAMGVAQEDVIKDLQLIGDVAAGAQVPIEEMTLIYAKGLGRDKLQAEELNQMIERGVPILDALIELQRRRGKELSARDVYKAAERGVITFKDMREALALLTEEGGVFHKQMELQSQTMKGLASTLRDNLFNAAVKVGEKLDEVFGVKEGMKRLIDWVQDMTARFETFAEENPGLVKIGFSLAAIAAAAGPLLIGLGLAASGFAVFAAGLAAVLSPIGLVIGAVVAAGAVAAWLIADWEGATAFFEKTWNDILAAIPDDPFGWIREQWDDLLIWLSTPMNAANIFGAEDSGGTSIFAWVERQWDAALDWIGRALPATWDWLVAGGADVFAWVSRQWDTAKDGIGTAATDIWNWLSTGSEGVFAWVSRQWDAAKDGIGTAATDIWNWLSTGSEGVFAWVSRQWDAALDLVEKPATAVWNWLKNPDPGVFSWLDAEWAQTIAGIGAGASISVGLDLPTAAEALAWAGGALTAISTAIDKIDWKKLGKTIGQGVRAGFLALMSLFDGNGQASGGVKAAFRRVFAGIGDLLVSILRGALNALIGFIEGAFGVDLGASLDRAIDAVTGWLPDWVREPLGLGAETRAPTAQPSRIPQPPRQTLFGGPGGVAPGAARVGGEIGLDVRVTDERATAHVRRLRSDNPDVPIGLAVGHLSGSP